MKKEEIIPLKILTIDTSNYMSISIIVKNEDGIIVDMSKIDKGIFPTNHVVRGKLREQIEDYIEKYNIDTIVTEEHKLFIDSIGKYPDPHVLRNVLLGFGVDVMIEDNFWDKVKYIFRYPEKVWVSKVMNKYDKYSVDFYKRHILKQDYSTEALEEIQKNNYYKALCLSESVYFDELKNEGYWINLSN